MIPWKGSEMASAAFRPRGTHALVSGAASGIGLATARLFVQAGLTVALLDRDGDAIAEARSSLLSEGGDTVPVNVDLSDPEATAEAAKRLLHEWGRCDILVNAAGVVDPDRQPDASSFQSLTWESWDYTFAVNVRAPFILMQTVSASMISCGGGAIVNVSSSSAFRANAAQDYASSKAALCALTRTAAAFLGPHNVNVNAVAPGLTRTPFAGRWFETDRDYDSFARSGPGANLLGRPSEPEDVAATIGFLCTEGARQITGQTVHTSGGQVV
jgi:NAD(P)-dependent dehydrogenase (short-subunit alcohol dehydrogenase family)